MIDRHRQRALAMLLADAKPHSLREVQQHLALSSDELHELIAALTHKGLGIKCDEKACRLTRPIAWLDEKAIRAAMGQDLNANVSDLEIFWSTDSTNTRLLEAPGPGKGRLRVCLAEFQSSGRSRLQRPWQAPLGGGLCMSVSWALGSLREDIATAGLVAGVAVRNALDKCGVRDLQLKWPNDVVWQWRKIGGLLLEVRSEAKMSSENAAKLIMGIGLNYSLDAAARADITRLGGLEPGDILEASGGSAPDRNRLVAAILSELMPALQRFSQEGFEPFANAWRLADACKDAPVLVTTQTEKLSGIARGIDAHGALQLDINGKIKSIVSAQVSLRRT